MEKFGFEFIDEVSNKYAESGGAETATLGEPTQDINSLMFLDIWVENLKSDGVDASVELVSHKIFL